MLKNKNKNSKRLTSLDLLLFSGDERDSTLVKVFTISAVSHVGLVYECPVTNELYVWESGNLPKGTGPLITKKGCMKRDAHLVSLRNRIKTYKGSIYAMKLFDKKKRKDIDQKKYDSWISRNLGNTYSSEIVRMWNSRNGNSLIPLTFLEEHTDGGNGWMCTQLVALTLEHMGVVNLLQPSSDIMPVDFFEEFTKPKHKREIFEMLNNYHFGKIELLAFNKS